MSKQENQKLTIMYIDDSPDPWLSRYLADFVKERNQSGKYRELLVYDECKFDPSKPLREFLYSDAIGSADIFIIDSRLFENSTKSTNSRYKGEELELLLRKVRPYTEVIIVSQKKITPKQNIVPKYSVNSDSTFADCKEKYNKELPLDEKIRSVIGIRVALREFFKNKSWGQPLHKKIQESVYYTPSYDDLSASDIDRLIKAFQRIEKKINEN